MIHAIWLFVPALSFDDGRSDGFLRGFLEPEQE
jgi:hypothetical protein